MAPAVIRVVSLLPSATDTLNELIKNNDGREPQPFELCGCSHECEILGGQIVRGLPRKTPVQLTQSRIGDIPIEDINLAFNASIAAIQEFMTLCQVR